MPTLTYDRALLTAHCLAAVLIGSGRLHAADNDEKPAVSQPAAREIELTFRLIDEQSQGVGGAKVGLECAYLVHPGSQTKQPDWHYYLETVSDPSGVVKLRARHAQFKSCCLVCRHAERRLVAIHPIDAAQKGTVDVVMLPECRVSGTIDCKELTSLSRGVGRTNARLLAGKRTVMECRTDDGKFHFFVPPGEFTIYISGSDILGRRRTLEVPPGQTELSLSATEVSARPLALLVGKPAPELREVRGWKNTAGITLADLRGKWVLLEFWGVWCGPCIGRMPELFAAYDELKDKGLEVIAVHCDGNDDSPVDTVAKLDEKLKNVVAQQWSGRDLPFPVALTTGLLPFVEGGEPVALGAVAADYGITSYPTLVLINPEGHVVGQVSMKQLNELLAADANK